jgi:hypothetical protein
MSIASIAVSAHSSTAVIDPSTIELIGRTAIAVLAIVALAAASLAVTPADVAVRLGMFSSP